jgi:type IV secretory pathway protease TraF
MLVIMRMISLSACAWFLWLLAHGSPPLVFINRSASAPKGLYWHVNEALGVGKLVLVRIPPNAEGTEKEGVRNASAQTLSSLNVAAGKSETVCVRGGVLWIGTRSVANVGKAANAAGVSWRGCRALAEGEWWLSDNSLKSGWDSRDFGPVDEKAIVGIYRPLIFW